MWLQYVMSIDVTTSLRYVIETKNFDDITIEFTYD